MLLALSRIDVPAIVLVVRHPLTNADSLRRHEGWARPLQRWEGALRLALNASLGEAEARCGCPLPTDPMTMLRPAGGSGGAAAAGGCAGLVMVSYTQLVREPRAALGALLARLQAVITRAYSLCIPSKHP